GEFDVLKTMKGEMRLVDFAGIAPGEINVRGAGAAEIFRIKRAVGAQAFAVSDDDGSAGGEMGKMESNPAGNILAQIIDENARLDLDERNGLELRGDADRFGPLGD